MILIFFYIPATGSSLENQRTAKHWYLPVLGGSHFFVRTGCFRFSHIYIYIWAGENCSGYQIILFSNSPGSQIGQLSYIQQQPVFTT